MELKEVLSVHTIVCPQCKVKQTGIVKESPGLVFVIPSESGPSLELSEKKIPHGMPYIRCSYIPCQYFILSDELAEATAQRVQFPNQILKH